jgi:GNAT superfamily N-acetyltransferase
MPPEEFEVSKLTWRGRAVDRWTLALHLNSDSRPAAWATFVLRPPECPFAGWWVSDLQVRARYRGAGLEEDLISKAEELLARGRVTLQRSKE